MQTILGSGGAIGIELSKALKLYTDDIRLVSRNPKKVNETDELFPANLVNPMELRSALKGSTIVYVTVGFPYSHKIWKQNWPTFIENLLKICETEGCKLVFFDNVYMYDKNNLNPMTENSIMNPPSKKGKIREQLAQMIIDKIHGGNLKALIARSADFYGPSIDNSSILTEMVFKPLSKDKKANWMMNDMVLHSFTYTLDAGKATALLGNTEKAYGHIWHLPTAPNPLTGKEWVHAVAKQMGKKPQYRIISKFMVRLIGLFTPVMKESVEMLYQYDRHYVFDSSRFEKEFNCPPTSYADGIKEIVDTDYT